MSYTKILSFFSLMFFLILQGCWDREDPNKKVLNIPAIAKVKSFDPVDTEDIYSWQAISTVYESLFEYHYLKRPYELVPLLAESLPEISSDGKIYTIKLKKGVFFHHNKCFPEGKGREVTAFDVVYSLKRMADPKLASKGWWMLENKIVGLDEWRKEQTKAIKTNYNVVVEGIQAINPHTIQIKLTNVNYQFIHTLANPPGVVVAKEAVEFYGKDFLNHPVGTGPFVLDQYDQSNKIVYKRNPNYREVLFPEDSDLGQNLTGKGKKIPFVEEIIQTSLEESQPRWLNFVKGKFDLSSIPKDSFDSVASLEGNLLPEFQKKGVALYKSSILDVTFYTFNLENTVLKNLKLRQAMAMAFDRLKSGEMFYNNRVILAQGPIPPGLEGYDLEYRSPYLASEKQVNLEEAKKLLAEAGYPEGKGLPPITLDVTSSTEARQGGEFFKNQMALLGIKIEVISNPWGELVEKVNKGTGMIFAKAWMADYPDAENFLQLFYGPNKAPGPNDSRYDNPVFNKMFQEALLLPPGEERALKYKKLNKLVAEEVPAIFVHHRLGYTVAHGWLENLVPTDMAGFLKYLDINIEKRKELKSKL